FARSGLLADIELAIQAGRVEQRHQRAVALLLALRLDRRLLQVRLVDPDLLPVGDDQLLERTRVLPTEQARRGDGHAAAALLLAPTIAVEYLLLEAPFQALEPAGEFDQLLACTGERRQGEGQAQAEGGKAGETGGRTHVLLAQGGLPAQCAARNLNRQASICAACVNPLRTVSHAWAGGPARCGRRCARAG